MNDFVEKRQFPRFVIPVVIYSPDFSNLPIVPVDISGGGFMVLMTKRPESASSFKCTIHISGEVFENCEGRVVWIRENQSQPTAWSVGIMIEDLDESQGRLVELVDEVRSLLEGM